MNQNFAEAMPKWLTVARLKWFIALLIALWIATRLASFFWLALGVDSNNVGLTEDAASVSAAAQTPKLSLASIASIRIFGEGEQDAAGEAAPVESIAEIDPSQIPNDAPATSLPIKLTGLISAGDSIASTAMILYQADEASYKLDDKLPPNDQATLVRVLADKIIIRNLGRYESLVLYDENSSNSRPVVAKAAAPKASTSDSKVIDKRSDPRSIATVSRIKEMIEKRDVQNLTKIINVSLAKNDDGGVKGYKVAPGQDLEAFESIGFQSGDVISGINGVALDNPQQAGRMMAEISNSPEIEVTIERGGQDITLVVNTAGQQ